MTEAPLIALGVLLAVAVPQSAQVAPSPRPSPAASVSPARPPSPVRPSARPSPSPKPSPSATPAVPRPRSYTPSGKASPKAKRVFTNEDLPSPSAESADEGPPTPEAAERSDEAAGYVGGAPEAHWRQRGNEARAAIRGAEQAVQRLEERITALRNDRAPLSVTDPNREQTRQAEIAAAVKDLEAATQALAEARKALDELEEEARRKGVPPGWVRER